MNAALNVFILYLQILKGTVCNSQKILVINDTGGRSENYSQHPVVGIRMHAGTV